MGALHIEEAGMPWIAYQIVNQVNGKKYIGITSQPLARRFIQHAGTSARDGGHALGRAMRDHGPVAFQIEHIASAWDKTSMLDLERILIVQENTLVPSGYNRTTGGVAPRQSAATLARMAHASRTRWNDPDYRKRMSRSMSEALMRPEVRARRSEITRELMSDPDYRARAIAAMKTRAALTKVGEATRRSWSDPEHRARRVQAISAAKSTPEGKADLARATQSRWANPQARATQAERMREVWAARRAKA